MLNSSLIQILFLMLFLLSGCISSVVKKPKYDYRAIDGMKGYYRFHANSYALKRISSGANLNTCYYKDKCVLILRKLILKVVNQKLIPQGRCIDGFEIVNKSVVFDEHARIQATFYCK